MSTCYTVVSSFTYCVTVRRSALNARRTLQCNVYPADRNNTPTDLALMTNGPPTEDAVVVLSQLLLDAFDDEPRP